MLVARLGQSTKSRTKILFLVVQICKLKNVDAFIEQLQDIFYTTLRERLKVFGENVVILVIFC